MDEYQIGDIVKEYYIDPNFGGHEYYFLILDMPSDIDNRYIVLDMYNGEVAHHGFHKYSHVIYQKVG